MPMPVPCAVIFAAEVTTLAAFYRGVFSMKELAGDATHTVLGLEGFELVIHQIHGATASSEAWALREEAATKLCLPVADLAVARVAAARLGGQLKPIAHEWVWRGVRACDGNDPEGNVVQARQLD